MSSQSSSSTTSRVGEEFDVKCIQTTICEWKIGGIRNQAEMRELRSPSFWHFSSTEWRMVLQHEAKCEWYLSFQLLSALENSDEAAEVRASVTWRGVTRHVYAETCSVRKRTFTCWKRVQFFMDGTTSFLLPTIIGEVCFHPTTKEFKESPNANSVLLKDLPNDNDDLGVDLGALLDSGDLWDIALCAGDTELRAHRIVLSARSPVFAAILRHDSTEAQTGMVHIQDIEADTLREILRYIYTGRAPRVKEMAGKLLVAADKYDLRKLKQLCEVEMADNLTVENSPDYAIIAVTHNCYLLKQAVISFMKKNIFAVLSSDSWANAATQHTQTVIQINCLLAD